MKRKQVWMTEFSSVQSSFMIGYFAIINEYEPRYDDRLFLNTVVKNHIIPSESNINL